MKFDAAIMIFWGGLLGVAAGRSEQGRQLAILVTQIELLLAYAEKVSGLV